MVLTNRDKALGILGSRKKLFKKVLDMFTHPLVSCCPVMSEPRNTVPQPPLNFYEFFCGGGMARAGLGEGWKCVRANDFDPKKCEVYAANWGRDALIEGDVRKLEPSDLPDIADLAWASFPCQDLSLAGTGAGLKGDRSGTFWPFWKLVNHLCEEHRAPRMIVLENVYGTLTAHWQDEALGKPHQAGGFSDRHQAGSVGLAPKEQHRLPARSSSGGPQTPGNPIKPNLCALHLPANVIPSCPLVDRAYNVDP